MKSITSLAVLASVSLAQNSIIGLPTTGYTVTKGGNVLIQLQLPVRCIFETLKAKGKLN
jgi:hypothetical protein